MISVHLVRTPTVACGILLAFQLIDSSVILFQLIFTSGFILVRYRAFVFGWTLYVRHHVAMMFWPRTPLVSSKAKK